MRRVYLCLTIGIVAGMVLAGAWLARADDAAASSSTLIATNSTGLAADRLVGGMFQVEVGGSATLDVNAPGCDAPAFQSTSSFATTLPPTIGHPLGINIYIVSFEAQWASPCVDPGEAVVLGFPGAVSYGPLDGVTLGYTFSNTLVPTATPTATPFTTDLTMAIDCDVNTAGVQSSCDVPLGSASTQVDVVLINNGPATDMEAFDFVVENLDVSRLKALSVACPSPGLDCNPDFDQASITGFSWHCAPIDEDNWSIPGDQSFASCLADVVDTQIIGVSTTTRLARITYGIPSSASAGTAPLTLNYVVAYSSDLNEIMSCSPVIFTPGTCVNATVNLFEPPPGSTATPTATPSPTGSPAPPPIVPATPIVASTLAGTPTGFFLALDCALSVPGLQDDCTYHTDADRIDIGIVAFNPGTASNEVQSWEANIIDPDTSRLDPPNIPGYSVDQNPDANDEEYLANLNCYASNDDDPLQSAARSRIGCATSPSGPAIPLPAGSSALLATVHYDVPPAAQEGTVELTQSFGLLVGGGTSYLGYCPGFAPPQEAEIPCLPATITLIDPPPSVHKVPEGNAANADAGVPKANLWLCAQPAPCAGPGEGSLHVVERAENVHTGDENADTVEDGLGAYEFTVEYDNFVIASVNPCDLVFGPGGAGSSRGPVDELDSSDNPDCQPDPGALNNGSCVMSLILENLVHFGCVTGGQTPGPTGDFDLASLNLIPHEDLANDLFPGNNNGVLTVVKDNGCELVDVFGHPATGSVNGGLTPECGDLAVTVRILEGDLDLDCDVDVTDAQAIAGHYGAFFGGLLYQKWLDLEPELHDLDIDIKDIQKVFGRVGSTCQAPVPAQPPLDPPVPFG